MRKEEKQPGFVPIRHKAREWGGGWQQQQHHTSVVCFFFCHLHQYKAWNPLEREKEGYCMYYTIHNNRGSTSFYCEIYSYQPISFSFFLFHYFEIIFCIRRWVLIQFYLSTISLISPLSFFYCSIVLLSFLLYPPIYSQAHDLIHQQ